MNDDRTQFLKSEVNRLSNVILEALRLCATLPVHYEIVQSLESANVKDHINDPHIKAPRTPYQIYICDENATGNGRIAESNAGLWLAERVGDYKVSYTRTDLVKMNRRVVKN